MYANIYRQNTKLQRVEPFINYTKPVNVMHPLYYGHLMLLDEFCITSHLCIVSSIAFTRFLQSSQFLCHMKAIVYSFLSSTTTFPYPFFSWLHPMQCWTLPFRIYSLPCASHVAAMCASLQAAVWVLCISLATQLRVQASTLYIIPQSSYSTQTAVWLYCCASGRVYFPVWQDLYEIAR